MLNYGINTNYNALQVRFERRLSRGISLTAAYAYSHQIDNAQETTNNGGCGCQNPRDFSAERASGVYDQRHSLIVSYVWELPFAKSLKGPSGALLGGWAFEGIITLQSGNPFDIRQSSDSQNNDGIWERPNLVGGQSLSVPNQDPSLWFNTNAFTPSVFVYGNSPRNPIVGPGTHAFDLSLRKSFKMPFGESQRLEFRAEAFNAFNTPQFSNPDSRLGDGAFGQVTSTKLDNRELQLALKYYF